jgi:hypothetical protein
MSSHSADEAAIRHDHQTAVAALNRGEVKAWAANFAPDADYMAAWGTCRRAARTLKKGSKACSPRPFTEQSLRAKSRAFGLRQRLRDRLTRE